MQILSRLHSSIRAVFLGLALLLVLEGVYLVAGNALLARKLAAAARDAGVDLRCSGLRTLFPGDLRAGTMELTAPEFRVRATGIRGRIAVRSLFGDAFTLSWLRIGAFDVHWNAGSLPSRAERVIRHEPRVAPAGLFGGEKGDSSRLRIESARGIVRSFEFGERRIEGTASAELREIELSGHSVSGTAELSIERARLQSASDGAPATFRGTLSARLPGPSEADPARAGEVLTIHGDLRADVTDLSQLHPALPPVALTNGRLRTELRREPGWESVRGFIEVRAAELAIAAARGSGPGARFRDVHARAGCYDSAACTQPGGRYAVSFEAARLELPSSGLGGPFAFDFSAELEPGDSLQRIRIEEGRLRVSRLAALVARAEAPPSLSADFAMSRGEWSRRDGLRLRGSLRARGEDASELLELLSAPPAARWMLAELEGEPFTLSLELSRSPAELELAGIRVSTGRADARGAVYIAAETTSGAVLIERGALRIGLSFDDEGVARVRSSASSEWLAGALSAARP